MNIAKDTSFYLDSTAINNPEACSTIPQEEIKFGPNPVINNPLDNLAVTVVRDNAVAVSIKVYAENGQEVYSTSGQQNPGIGIYTIPMKNLNSGIYYAVIFINGEKAVTEKIIR